MKNTYFFIILFFILGSCTSEKRGTDLTKCTIIKASINSEDRLPLDKYSIDVKLIPLETSKECFIGSVQSIIYKNARFYIKSFLVHDKK